MAAMWGGIASAVGSIAGNAISSIGAANLNLANRQFSAQQALQQEQFQQSQSKSAEQWMQQMSDTQMQRRVQDLKQAGLNPLLAISQGGASAPTISPQSGAMAQPNSAGGNPLAAWGNLGQQAATAAQVANTIADTKKTESETPVPRYIEIGDDGTVSVNADAGHELGEANLANLKATVNQTNQNVTYLKALANQSDKNAAFAAAQAFLAGQQGEILQATKQAVIKQGLLGGAEAGATMKFMQDPFWGPVIKFLQTISPIGHSAASVLGAIK